jgi:hypothetical protein
MIVIDYGRFGNDLSQSSPTMCSQCSSGRYALVGASSCINCAAGTFQVPPRAIVISCMVTSFV